MYGRLTGVLVFWCIIGVLCDTFIIRNTIIDVEDVFVQNATLYQLRVTTRGRFTENFFNVTTNSRQIIFSSFLQDSRFLVGRGINFTSEFNENSPLIGPFINDIITKFYIRKTSADQAFVMIVKHYDETVELTYPSSFSIKVAPRGYFRLELVHLSYFIIQILLYVGLLIIIAIFHRKQPLKSRGILPILACMAQIINIISGIQEITLTFEDLSNSCATIAFVRTPITICLITISLLHLTRFVILIQLNKRKEFFIKNNRSGELTSNFKILKYLSFWWVNCIIIVGIYVLYCLLSLVMYAISSFKCTTTFYISTTVTFYVFVCIIGLLLLIIMLIDLILSCRIGFCSIFKLDIFWFRFEFYVLGTFTFLISIALYIYQLTASAGSHILASFIINTITFHALLFMQCGFVTIVTILGYMRSFCKKPSTNEMKIMLEDREGIEVFLEFAKKEYSVENVSAFLDIKKFQKIPSLEESQRIYHLYFNGASSELETNVSRTPCRLIKQAIDARLVNQDLFDPVMLDITSNLSDTFSRLQFTEQYLEYVSGPKFVQDVYRAL